MEQTMIKGFKKVCPFCNKIVSGIYQEMVEHNYNEHLRACRKKDKKIKEEEKTK